MFRLEMFDGKKTYMFPNGAVATPDAIRAQFPAVDSFPHVLEVNGNVLQAVMEFAAVRQQCGIPDSETDENALTAMDMALTLPPVPQPPTAEERLAAAAEFQNITLLPDASMESKEEQSDEIIEMNFKKGLWNKQMVDVCVKKGVITKTQYKKITGRDYTS